MPTYEFKCQACKNQFTTTSTVKELEEGKITCPACGASDVRQLATAFTSKTSRKS